MAYRFSRDDGELTGALRRIAGEELAAALAHAPGAPGSVHDSRKRVKKLRALLRLVRSGLREARTANAALRDAASGLSALRDAEVVVETFDRMAPGAAEGAVRAHLVHRLERAAADPAQAGRSETFRAVLADLLARVPEWTVRGRDEEVLAQGLVRARAGAVAAMAEARRSRAPEALHAWRKRVKDIWYQARLFAPAWPAVLEPWGAEAGELAEILGRHHDLAVLADLLETMPAGAAAEVAALRPTLGDAAAALEAEALARGRILHATAPAEEAALWLAWRAAWLRG